MSFLQKSHALPLTSQLLHPLLLLAWIAIGASLRFARLDALAPWTDECATLVFSLGNSFHSVPLNQLIDTSTLLAPLEVNPLTGIRDVVHHLFAESTHPPIYFVLTHLWLKLFSPEDGLVSIWAARLLSALFGVASIPAMFIVSWLTFRSRLVAQIAAAMMAVSPFGIFLAQEARHYTLTTLLVIASLGCFLKAVKAIHRYQPLPTWIGLAWVGINSLGIATHYFFTLTIAAQAIILFKLAWQQLQHYRNVLGKPHWLCIYGIAAGTLAGCLVWLPALQTIYDSPPTRWIYDGDPGVLEPILRVLLWGLSMLIVLPSDVTHLPLGIVIVSGTITLGFLLAIAPHISKGLKQYDHDNRIVIQALRGYILAAIALFFGFTYLLGMDLTLAPRYHFVYFPAVVTLLGASLAACWQQTRGVEGNKHQKRVKFGFNFPLLQNHPRTVVITILLTGLLSGLTTVWNLGYLQRQRPDLVASIIHTAAQSPVLIATTHKHHGQTGRMMGLAWNFKQHLNSEANTRDWTATAQFFLAPRNSDSQEYTEAIAVFQNTLKELPRPLDLWLVEFRADVDDMELESQHCLPDPHYRNYVGEYKYRRYRCTEPN